MIGFVFTFSRRKRIRSWKWVDAIKILVDKITSSTTGDGFFVECPRLCRVFFIGHSVKRLFAESQRESTRQTNSTRQKGGLPSAEHSTKNNTRQRPGLPSVEHSANQNTRQRAAVVNGWQPPLTLCWVSSSDTRQSADLPSVIFWHSANHIFFSLLTSKLFLQSSYSTWYSMFQCGTFLGLFLYFFHLFYLIEFSWIIQIITASHSNNEKMNEKNDIHVI